MYNDGEVLAPGERRVVAVARNTRPSPTHPQDSWPNVFVPYTQNPLRGMYIAVRAPSPAVGAMAIRQEVAALDPLLPVYAVKSIDELLDYWMSGPNLNALIVDVLAAIGTLLTLIGIYSVVAVFVSQRTREIGIRAALGAQRRDVVRMVLWKTLRPGLVGVVVGTGAALLGSRAIQSMLNGVSPLEPRAFVGSVVLLLGVVVAAAMIPARVAARLDPLIALRSE
jgi:putative ABC transport system permease protein